MTDQKQEAGEGALAVQSGRDTVINRGVTIDEMKSIVELLANQLLIPSFMQKARELVEPRLLEFEAHLLKRFTADDKARPDAFADPDFQAVVSQAQNAHARCGNPEVRDVLVDLIARRSTERNRTRLSLSLNQAIEKAAMLTHEEFAALSLCYCIRYVQFRPNNFEAFVGWLTKNITPLLKDVFSGTSVLAYLQAQGCVTSGVIAEDLHATLRHHYLGVMSKGFARPELSAIFDEESIERLSSKGVVIACLHDSALLQFGALNKTDFDETLKLDGIDEAKSRAAWQLFERSIWTQEETIQYLTPHFPEISQLYDLWAKAHLGNVVLTSVGIAIAHANMQRVSGFNAELGMWIR